MLGWHFARDDMRLGYGDGRAIIAGETLTINGTPSLCESGLHASKRIIDALRYARGRMICRVELTGTIITDADKAVATARRCMWHIDGETVLRTFARWCARSVVHLWDAPDVVVRYLDTGDESIRAAAWTAARDATEDAASGTWDAAWATRAATSDGTWDAAWVAAEDAATVAAWLTAGEAAAVAWAAQDEKLTEMVLAARKAQPPESD